MQRSFENVYLVPMPKDTVDVTVNLYNNRREIMATMTHTVVPTDILIHQINHLRIFYHLYQSLYQNRASYLINHELFVSIYHPHEYKFV